MKTKLLALLTVFALLIPLEARAQLRVELGGTGSSLSNTDNGFAVGANGGTTLVLEKPDGTCDASSLLQFNSSNADGVRLHCVPSGGAGDVTAVGPGCASGACFTKGPVTTGTEWMVWEGTTNGDSNQITITAPADPASAISIAMPTSGGTFAASGTSPVSVAATGAISVANADVSNKGIASFADADFTVTNGAVSLDLHQVFGEVVGALTGTGDKQGAIAHDVVGTGATQPISAMYDGYGLKQVADCSVSCNADCFSVSGTTFYLGLDPLLRTANVVVDYQY